MTSNNLGPAPLWWMEMATKCYKAMARPARSSIWLIWDPDAPRIARWQQPILDDPPWPLSKTRKTNGSHTACGLPSDHHCGDLWWSVVPFSETKPVQDGTSRPTVPTCREFGVTCAEESHEPGALHSGRSERFWMACPRSQGEPGTGQTSKSI